MITRRALMGAAAAILPLAACATGAPTASQLTADAALISSGIGTLVSAIKAAGVTLPVAVLATVNTAVTDIQGNAGQIGDALGSGNVPILDRIMSGLSIVTNVLTPFFPAAQLAYSIVSAAVALAKFLLSLFRPAGAAQGLMVQPGAPNLMPLTPDEARRILKGA